MPGRRKEMVDIRAIVHHIRAGESDRRIGKDLKVDRRTVKKYRAWAKTHGLLKGELPEAEALESFLNN